MDNAELSRVPVLLTRTGPTEVMVVRTDKQAVAGWHRVGGALAAAASAVLGTQGAEGQVVGRLFRLDPTQAHDYERLTKKGSGGFFYGIGFDDNSKIARNFKFQELEAQLPAGVQAPPVDPLMVAMSVSMLQLQAQIEALTVALEQVGRDVKAVLDHLRLAQQAELLAAAETISAIYDRYVAGDEVRRVDWDRISHLEQVLKSTHRTVIGELHVLTTRLRFDHVDQAKKVEAEDGQRAQDLITLEHWVLVALERWAALAISARETRDEWTLAALNEMTRLVEESRKQAFDAVAGLREATQPQAVRGRSAGRRLITDGIVIGGQNDQRTIQRAVAQREVASQAATVAGELEAAETPGELTIEAAPSLSI